MKKLFEKIEKIEKQVEKRQQAAKKILVFIAEKLNNGAYDCAANFKLDPQQRFILKDVTELNNYIAQNNPGVVLIDDLIDYDDDGNKIKDL